MLARMVIDYTMIATVVVVGILLVLGPVLLLTYWLTRKQPDEDQ
jgi:hypothetical protein